LCRQFTERSQLGQTFIDARKILPATQKLRPQIFLNACIGAFINVGHDNSGRIWAKAEPERQFAPPRAATENTVDC
jgi:hypothetical protein